MSNWFLIQEGKEHGPVKSDRLRELVAAGQLRLTDLVRRDDMAKPCRADQIKGLFPRSAQPEMRAQLPEVRPATPDAKVSVRPESASFDSIPSTSAKPRWKQILIGFWNTTADASRLTALQVEKTKLQSITLPRAFATLGRHVDEASASPANGDEFTAIRTQIRDLKARIEATQTVAANQPTSQGVLDKAKGIAKATVNAANRKKLELQLAGIHADLGKAAFERLGETAGPVEIVRPIIEGSSRVKQIDDEQAKLARASSGRLVTPKRVAIVGVSAIMLLSIGVMLSALSVGIRHENDGGHAGQATHAKGGIKIVHAPYTQVIMQAIPASLTHEIDWNTKPNEQADQTKPKPFEPSTPVVVADISLVDFRRGPNGEAIEMDRYSYGSNLAQQGYYYRNKQGEVVNHGPWTNYQNGKKTSEFLYIHGVLKSSYTCYGSKPECLEVYHGDGKHTKEYRGYYDNGAIRVIERYLLQHYLADGKERTKAIPHGVFEDYYDNTIVKRAKLHDQIAGLKKLELFENGTSVGVRILDRQGNIATERGRLTPKKG